MLLYFRIVDQNGAEATRLLRAAAGQDRAAFAQMYDLIAPRLYGLALRILQNETIAEDVVQDVFVTLWEQADSLSARGVPALAYSLVICRNRCIDRLRRARNEEDRAMFEDVPAPGSADEVFQNLDQRNLREFTGRALDSLPEGLRLLVELSYFRGLNLSQIARELDLPLGTVKTRTALAMKQLRAFFKKHGTF